MNAVERMEREALEQLYPDIFLNQAATGQEAGASTDGQTRANEANSSDEDDLES